MNAFVVESPVVRKTDGVRVGTARVWVATEERAKQIASEHPERTYRPVTENEMPEKVRAGLASAAAPAGAAASTTTTSA